MDNTKLLSSETIQKFVTDLFVAGGMEREEASFFSDTIVQSNLWGIDSHGIIRVPTYYERVKCNAINQKPNMKVEQLAKAVSLIDADGAAGCSGAKKAMELAIENASKCGIGACGVMNSNHFGAAALYSKMAAEKGMIGIAMTNVLPLISMAGALKPIVGNNPISFAIPTYNDYPFNLDMSLSLVAGGKLHLAASKGEKIPMDWAINKNGEPTDDPKEGLEGFLLPIGGYKGLGLAYAIDIISGLITGGVFADKMRSMYKNPTDPSLTGHMMIALDVSIFMSEEQMKTKIAEYHDYISNIPLTGGRKGMAFPGEMENNNMKKRLVDGIPVPLSTIETLNKLAKELNISPLC